MQATLHLKGRHHAATRPIRHRAAGDIADGLRQHGQPEDADAALQYVGPRYVQHNPNAADGPQGFRQFIAFLRDKYPDSHSEIVTSFVDGEHVILHVRAVREPGTRGNAIVDIFRLENGKIVEHWDVTQAIPEKTASGNPMF